MKIGELNPKKNLCKYVNRYSVIIVLIVIYSGCINDVTEASHDACSDIYIGINNFSTHNKCINEVIVQAAISDDLFLGRDTSYLNKDYCNIREYEPVGGIVINTGDTLLILRCPFKPDYSNIMEYVKKNDTTAKKMSLYFLYYRDFRYKSICHVDSIVGGMLNNSKEIFYRDKNKSFIKTPCLPKFNTLYFFDGVQVSKTSEDYTYVNEPITPPLRKH
jgi:hypothetical protein